MKKVFIAAALMLTGATGCGGQGSHSAVVTRFPEGVFVLSGALIPNMLNQCGRDVPQRGEGSWQPAPTDIALLEAHLAAALAQEPEARETDFRKAPQGWWRQYVGIVRGGKRFIYGNFFDPPGPYRPGDPKPDLQHEVTVICDGGPYFFGVEFDAQVARFSHFGFNGHL